MNHLWTPPTSGKNVKYVDTVSTFVSWLWKNQNFRRYLLSIVYRYCIVDDVKPILRLHCLDCRYFSLNIVDMVDIALSTMLNQYWVYIFDISLSFFKVKMFNTVDIALSTISIHYRVYCKFSIFSFCKGTIYNETIIFL